MIMQTEKKTKISSVSLPKSLLNGRLILYPTGGNKMKVWLYYRLSRDEDAELNSLTNQKNILVEYAKANGHEIVGESFDDNVSGMHFNREGINKIYEQVEQNNIEAIIVKDMSRLGRHKTQTALFIDYLREHDVRVLSVTENLDTSNEDDDLIIGFKGLFNDMYARDISKKVRAGMVQKQKKGFVMIPPLGYFKDRRSAISKIKTPIRWSWWKNTRKSSEEYSICILRAMAFPP